VPLEGAALCCGDFPLTGGKELPLPPLNAVVTSFPQEHLVSVVLCCGVLWCDVFDLVRE